MSEETNNDNSDEQLTENKDTRWEYLNTFMAAILLVSFVAMVLLASAGVITLAAVSQPWFLLYASAVATSLVWTFGKDVYTTFKG